MIDPRVLATRLNGIYTPSDWSETEDPEILLPRGFSIQVGADYLILNRWDAKEQELEYIAEWLPSDPLETVVAGIKELTA